MAQGDEVAGTERLVHNCKRAQVGTDNMPLGAAFQLEGTHTELSTTSIDRVSTSADPLQQLRDVRTAMVKGNFNPPKTSFFATIVAERVTSLRVAGAAPLRVLHDPDDNVGHCMIYGMPAIGSQLAVAVGQRLAERVSGPATANKDL
jgi:hypothetical protein